MLNFSLSEEQQAFVTTAKEFAVNEMMPVAAHYDQTMDYPWDIVKKAHSNGLMNLYIPESHGGMGLGALESSMIYENLAYGCSGITTAFAANDLALGPLIIAGTKEQINEFAHPMTKNATMAAYCVTEPGAGSDVASIKTRAVPEGDHYLLTGSKMWITNASHAKWFFVLATLDPSLGPKAMCAFAIPADLPGIKPGKKEVNLGQRCSDTRGISFDNVKVPKKYLLGKEGEGFKIAMKAFDHSRPMVAALAVGVAQCAMDHAIKYALQRKAFGKEIAQHQAVAFMIADMARDIEASRLLYQKAAWLGDHGERNSKNAAFAKCLAGDMCVKVTQDAIQILGGYGYNCEYPVEKLYRDAKIFQIYEGTQQIQRLIISRLVLEEAVR